MLTVTGARRGASRRPAPSPEQHYHAYIMERIEDFKNSLPRSELLRIGDEAVAMLDSAADGQFGLTEMLVLGKVDELIRKRLRLPAFKRWLRDFIPRRAAQREPAHWGLEPAGPVACLLDRLEPEDLALLVGPATEGAALLLAAHDVQVVLVSDDMAAINRVETRAAGEALGGRLSTHLVRFGGRALDHALAPETIVHVALLDAAALAEAEQPARAAFVADLQARTVDGGVHVLLPGDGRLAPEAHLSLYLQAGWHREPGGGRRRGMAMQRGVSLLKPGD
ncbi:MAG: hypothetical protein NW201_13255 [Gemmatimonadales bacterium]|nr:hypothetical protein [Gemmatimonadales bacterium]